MPAMTFSYAAIPTAVSSVCPEVYHLRSIPIAQGALAAGRWQVNGMQGYTSPGAGTSVLNVRLNCPPEVTIHTLTRGPSG